MTDQPPPAAAARADVDEALLRDLTGQTDVSEPDHARALLGVAQREEAIAREQHERTRWPLRRARFRMLPVLMRIPPLIAALVITSLLIFTLAMLLIVVHLAGTLQLIAVISLGYTLGFGVVLYLLMDSPHENDQNRAAIRRRELRAAIDARVASAAKVMRLEQETRARQELLERVMQYGLELQRRRRRQQQRQQREKAQSPAPQSPPASPAPPDQRDTHEPREPREPEYGGG
jgi:hypothetical protein